MSEENKVEVPEKFISLVEQIEKLSVLELSELVKVLEGKFGVSAAAPMMMGAMPAAGGAGAAAAEEKTEFTVEFMEAEGNNHRWLNEGLAMYIDAHFESRRRFDDVASEWRERLRAEPLMTLDAILAFKPYSEKDRSVRLWYATAADFTSFLIRNGGAFNFSLFLKELKNGTPIDQALSSAYPGKYRSLQELYAVWRGTLGF
jgi:hypothetical protein